MITRTFFQLVMRPGSRVGYKMEDRFKNHREERSNGEFVMSGQQRMVIRAQRGKQGIRFQGFSFAQQALNGHTVPPTLECCIVPNAWHKFKGVHVTGLRSWSFHRLLDEVHPALATGIAFAFLLGHRPDCTLISIFENGGPIKPTIQHFPGSSSISIVAASRCCMAEVEDRIDLGVRDAPGNDLPRCLQWKLRCCHKIELIFPTDFYVLDMEDETSGKGTTLILGRPFLMTTRTKIDVHVGTLSMECGDTLLQFNIFEAMKHPTEDHSLFGIDLIDELVEEYLQLYSSSEDSENFVGSTDLINYLGSITKEADYEDIHDPPNFEDNNNDNADLDFEAKLLEVLDQVCNPKNPKCINKTKVKVVETKEFFSAQLTTIFTVKVESTKKG
ncbi:hypothetical protein CR513_18599, partial [Mucuna pruriens]